MISLALHGILTSHSYDRQCRLLLPQLEQVLSGLPTPLDTLFDQAYLLQLAEVSLSASNFRGEAWKMHVVSMSSKASNALQNLPERAFYVALTNVRSAFLAYLYRTQGEGRANSVSFPANSPRSNALLSELMIVKAWEHVSLNTLASALEQLASLKPMESGVFSTLEAFQNREVAFMRAKVLRFQGHFYEAYGILAALTPRDSKVGSQLSYVLCELGRTDEAIDELDRLAGVEKGMARTKLAMANTYLVTCLHGLSQGHGLDWRMLRKSQEHYLDLQSFPFPATYFGKISHLSVLLGLAVASHVDGQVDLALKAWQRASAASQAFLSTGYTDMIFAYSTSELQMRRGASAQSDILGNYAKTLFARTGRQHHFVGLGSYWPDILHNWFVTRGREPITPVR